MNVALVDVVEAGERLGAGEQAYEYQTEDRALRILGPACGFGAELLRRLRSEGLYAENLEEALAHARTRNVTLTGVWFVKR
ncbi:MAG: hypothetical protein ACREEM_54690 [Blastocatellia bacterium]